MRVIEFFFFVKNRRIIAVLRPIMKVANFNIHVCILSYRKIYELLNMKFTIHLFLFLFFTSNTYSQGYFFEKNATDIELSADGSFTITESLDVVFEEKRRGIIRAIPTVYRVNNKKRRISIRNVDVRNDSFKASSKGGNKEIRIGKESEFLVGKKSYQIDYKVQNAISSYKEHDEFYWNIVNFNTDTRTEVSTFSITYPESWKGKITEFKAFSGTKGNTGNEIVLHEEGNKIIGAHRGPLGPNEGITIAVNIPKGLITGNFSLIDSDENTKANWLVNLWNLIPLGLGSLIFFFYNKFEKEPKFDDDIPLQYHPPEGMSPAEVGTFYDHQVNKRDLISLLPYWGNRGILKIRPVAESEHDLSFYKLQELPTDSKDYEHELFDRLFKEGDVVLLSDLQNDLLGTMLKVSSKINKEVLQKELYDDISVKIFHKGWMIALGFACIILGVVLIIKTNAVISLIGLIALGIFCLVIHARRPKLSKKGNRSLMHLKGLYQFLNSPSQEKILSLEKSHPNYLHDIYPYVLAFGLDESWMQSIKTFETVGAPIWYENQVNQRDQFSYQSLSDDLNVRNIEKVFYSSPQGSNGSSGGGFSGGSAGGGFGGGSTSSW